LILDEDQRGRGRSSKEKKVSKSKSSHDVLAGRSQSHDEHVLEDLQLPGSSRSNRRRKASCDYAAGGGHEDGSLSSWARYLKTKYGKGKALSFDGSATTGAVPDEVTEQQRPKRHSFSIPAHSYMGKNRIQLKFGSRGSEPGKLTWPRGICCCEGPDGNVQVVVADST